MKDSDWLILHKLFQTPNITKVANMLYMSQPSLTKRIKVIEEEFDVKIVERTSKGVEFTPEGEYLAKKAEVYIDFLEDIKNNLKSYKEEYEGLVTVGSAYSYSRFELADLLSDFSQNYPCVNFHIENDQSNKLYRKILEEKLSLAFICGDYKGPINKILVKQDKAYIASKEAIDMDQLPKMQRIDYRHNDKTKEILENWWNDRYEENQPEGMFAGTMEFAWKLIDKGWGYSCFFLPDGFKNDYNLHIRPLLDSEGNNVTRNTWLVYSKTKQLSKVEKEFIKYIENNLNINQKNNIEDISR